MPILQELSRKQVQESLAEASSRSVPICLTCRTGQDWHSLRTKIIRKAPSSLWLEDPLPDRSGADLAEGTAVGVSFKLKHHKHIFNTVVEAVGEFGLPDGRKVRAVCVTSPRRMQRVQRRAYHRVDVPRNRSVLAMLWQGGLAARQASEAAPAWEGWVTNLSAGGFQVRVSSHGTPDMEVGDLVGVRIDLGHEYREVVANAQFRQEFVDDRGVRFHGFQFVGLNESTEGREVLRRVGGIVCEFQRLQDRRRAYTA